MMKSLQFFKELMQNVLPKFTVDKYIDMCLLADLNYFIKKKQFHNINNIFYILFSN